MVDLNQFLGRKKGESLRTGIRERLQDPDGGNGWVSIISIIGAIHFLFEPPPTSILSRLWVGIIGQLYHRKKPHNPLIISLKGGIFVFQNKASVILSLSPALGEVCQ